MSRTNPPLSRCKNLLCHRGAHKSRSDKCNTARTYIHITWTDTVDSVYILLLLMLLPFHENNLMRFYAFK